jgi:hypothetical protein
LVFLGKKHCSKVLGVSKVVVMDVTETAIERKKKTEKILFSQEKTPQPKNASGH